jgi:hypothetical protein
MIVLPDPWESIPDNDKVILSKMLLAVKLNLAAVQIITLPEFTINDLHTFSPVKILAFGATCSPTVQPYINQSMGEIQLIQADRLNQLDDTRKKNLWSALRVMFGV